jgi:photosystem II stability/assembly factor-like uncharacterized protein
MKWLPLALSLATLTASSAALANGRFPAASQLVVSPQAPNFMVLRATYGVLVSKDAGKTWDWVCERSVGYSGAEDPSMGMLGAHTILAGTFEGLSVSPDEGCSWAMAGGELAPHVFIDVVVRPDAPSQALGLTSTYASDTDGGELYTNVLFATTDEGAHWARTGAALPGDALTETLEVAKSDPARIYVSAATGPRGKKQGRFFASTDTGTTFTEYPLTMNEAERAPYIAAVDPHDANRVYVRTLSEGQSRLLVTDDGGQNFRSVFEGPALLGFALSGDGSKVWIGNTDGLYVASKEALTFEKRSSVIIQCLAISGDTLYACSNEASGFILGASKDEGATWAPLLHLWTLRGPLACAPGTSTDSCQADWPPIKQLLEIEDDAGVDAGPPVVQGESGSDCACSLPSTSSDERRILAVACAVAAAFLGAARRFRRARRLK